MDNEKAGLVLNVIGQAVVDLIVGQIPITKDSVLKRLEHNKKYVGNVIEKGAHQEAAELASKGA